MGDRKRMPHGVMRRVPESPCENTSWDVRFCDPCSLLIILIGMRDSPRRTSHRRCASIRNQIIAQTSNRIVHTVRYGARQNGTRPGRHRAPLVKR